jgi:hypothetical protein
MKKKDVKEDGTKQLDLGIKEPFINKFFKLKGEFDLAILRFEVKKFLKDPLVWASLVISSVLIAQQIYLIYTNFSSLPMYLPVMRYFLTVQRKLVEKEYIVLFPSISVAVLILSFVFTSRYYNREKILTKFLLFSLLLSTLSQTIILIDLVKSF